MQIGPDMFPDHGSEKKCCVKEDEGGIKEGRKEGGGVEMKGVALLGVAKLPTHPTSFFP